MWKKQCFGFIKARRIYQHGKPGLWPQDKKESTWEENYIWQNSNPDSSFRVTQAVTEQLASLATADWPFYSQEQHKACPSCIQLERWRHILLLLRAGSLHWQPKRVEDSTLEAETRLTWRRCCCVNWCFSLHTQKESKRGEASLPTACNTLLRVHQSPISEAQTCHWHHLCTWASPSQCKPERKSKVTRCIAGRLSNSC